MTAQPQDEVAGSLFPRMVAGSAAEPKSLLPPENFGRGSTCGIISAEGGVPIQRPTNLDILSSESSNFQGKSVLPCLKSNLEPSTIEPRN